MSTFKKPAILALEDGKIFHGYSFGADGENYGEVVFNTSMTGYQEILTDPSYKGQIVTMTYPLIGNYGINKEDVESRRPFVEGFIVREYTPVPSNWRSEQSLGDYLKENNIYGIEGIDTRALTKHLRTYGAKQGVISTTDLNPESLVEKAKTSPHLVGRDLVKEVTVDKPYLYKPSKADLAWNGFEGEYDPEKASFHVVAYDCGIKLNILRLLAAHGCKVTVVPATASAEEVLSYNPDGIFLSNGPGDPEAVTYLIENVKKLIGKKPIFGICLGQQILGLAFGGKTYKLKFGHRGANHPVKQLATGKIEITVQNHGFCVDLDSVKNSGLKITHLNLNDMSNEGMEHEELPIFCVQYHPESSAGPHDARYLFQKFINNMEKSR
jgi:carbamoyl-phosphate synthase small subunit